MVARNDAEPAGGAVQAGRAPRDAREAGLCTDDGEERVKLQLAKSVSPTAILEEHPSAGAVPGGGGMVIFGTGGSLQLYGVPIETLAIVLSNMAGRPVVDKTGLTGRYDIHLEQPKALATDGTEEFRTSIFTTVQEQLGLRMESAKEPVEVLVIDRVERPSEN